MTSQAAPAPSRPHTPAPARDAPSGTRVGIISGLFLAPTALGFSAAPVALPALASALHVSAGSTAWVLASYSLTTAILTALSGRIADLRGLRVPLALAVAVLAAGTVIVMIAPDLGIVIAGRLIQGVGAGAAGVISFRLPALRITDPGARARSLGMMGLVVGLASGSGALLGGVLTSVVSWRWALALPGLSLLAAPMVLRLIPVGEDRHTGELDLRGAGLCALGVAALTVLIQARSTDLTWPLATLAAGIALASVILLRRHVRQRPLGFLPIRLLTNAAFRRAATTGFMLFAGYLIMVFAAPRLLLEGRHLTAVQIGLILLPAGLVSATISRLAGNTVARTGPWPLIVALTAASTAGLLLAAALGASPVTVVVALAACVAGFSAGQVTLMAALSGIVEADIQGIAVGVFQLVFITGGSVGAAAIGGLVSIVSLRAGIAILAILPAIGLLLALQGLRQQRAR